MGQCRNLLPIKLIEEFQTYLQQKGHELVATNDAWSDFGVRIHGKTYLVYTRAHTHAWKETVHASIYGPVINLAKEFLQSRKIPRKPDGTYV